MGESLERLSLFLAGENLFSRSDLGERLVQRASKRVEVKIVNLYGEKFLDRKS